MAIIPESEVFKSYPLPQAGNGGFQQELITAQSSGSIVNNNLPSLTNKISEALPKFELFNIANNLPEAGFAGLSAPDGLNSTFGSKSFGALSNGSFNSNISSALSGLGDKWQSGLSSLPGGFSSSDLQQYLTPENSGGGGRSWSICG